MYYEKLTKYKTKVNMSKYREDIQNIFNALLKEDTKFENYYLYKEDYDIFIDNIIGKIVSFNIPPFIMNEESPLSIDKTIFIKPKEKSIIGLMKKVNSDLLDVKPSLKTLDLTQDVNII